MNRRNSLHFERLRGRRGPALSKMFDEFVIIELRSGEIYAGVLDECFFDAGWIVPLISCKKLDSSGKRWVDHDIMIERSGKTIRDSMPYFGLSEMKEILVLKKKLRDSLSSEDAMQLYVDPHYRPTLGVKCHWNGERDGKHSLDCDSRLHEAITLLYGEATLSRTNRAEDDVNQNKIQESFELIRRRLLMAGARIP